MGTGATKTDAVGPVLKITFKRGALKIIIIGRRDSLSYLVFSCTCQEPHYSGNGLLTCVVCGFSTQLIRCYRHHKTHRNETIVRELYALVCTWMTVQVPQPSSVKSRKD